MGKESKKKHRKASDSGAATGAKANAPTPHALQGQASARRKMKRKRYEKEMRALHGELVAMQEWVKATGARVCIVFEGRDTAGKGGTIKRITERVSPRVFRVIALPAPSEREKSEMYIQRYLFRISLAAGEVVIFDRSWYNRAGGRTGHGLLHERTAREVARDGTCGREGDGRLRYHPGQVLA